MHHPSRSTIPSNSSPFRSSTLPISPSLISHSILSRSLSTKLFVARILQLPWFLNAFLGLLLDEGQGMRRIWVWRWLFWGFVWLQLVKQICWWWEEEEGIYRVFENLVKNLIRITLSPFFFCRWARVLNIWPCPHSSRSPLIRHQRRRHEHPPSRQLETSSLWSPTSYGPPLLFPMYSYCILVRRDGTLYYLYFPKARRWGWME